MKVRDIDDLDENLHVNLHVNLHMYAKTGASRSSHLFAGHNHIFREEHTYGRSHAQTNE